MTEKALGRAYELLVDWEGRRNKMAASMLVFVFFYVLTMRALYKMASSFSSWFSEILTRKGAVEKDLRDTIMELKNEQLQISAQDEFAKYARLQRRITKLNEDLSQQVKQRGDKISKRRQIVATICVGLLLVCHVAFLMTYRKQPVAVLPVEWFSPIGSVLAFPTGIAGAIGLPCWVVTSNRIISLALF